MTLTISEEHPFVNVELEYETGPFVVLRNIDPEICISQGFEDAKELSSFFELIRKLHYRNVHYPALSQGACS